MRPSLSWSRTAGVEHGACDAINFDGVDTGDAPTRAGIAGERVDTEELNDIVHHLYNLSPADVALINDWFQRRSLVG